MSKIRVSFPTKVEAIDIPAGQVPIIGTQMHAYKIATELVGRNMLMYDLARVAPTLLERHYADLKNPELREREGKVNKGYFFEALNAAVGPIEGELQIKVPEGCLPVTVVSPIERFEKDEETSSHNKIMQIELECESSLPVKFLYLDKGMSVRQIYKVLANNEIVVISLDGIIGGKRMTLPFLNGSILLSTGGASLSLSTEAPALPVFIVRQKNNKHKIIIHKPFVNINNGIDKETYVGDWMDRYVKLFEQYVRNHPDHYARYLYTIRKYPLPDHGHILKINNYEYSAGRKC